eukprot:1325468-Amorphochlora_amoeboformis.AAC.2
MKKIETIAKLVNETATTQISTTRRNLRASFFLSRPNVAWSDRTTIRTQKPTGLIPSCARDLLK